jgi:transposase
MATKRLSMRKIRSILKLKLKRGLTNRAAASAARASPGAVSSVMKRAKSKGLTSWEEVEPLEEAQLEALLYGGPTPGGQVRAEPDPVWMHTERQRKGVTLALLHLEYLEEHPDGLRYTAFCERYRKWTKAQRLSMRQVHRVGEKLFVDYSGDKPSVTDPNTGGVREAEFFVATLGASNYTFAEATWSQALRDWTASHVRALEFFGGVPAVVIPDQLRSAVSGPHRYDPDLNRSYAELADHYDTTVIPARPRKPKDKAKVENAVLVAQRWILARLRNEVFFSLAALNERIAELLAEFNARPMKGYRNQSRRERYELLDRPALNPLPVHRYVYAHWSKTRVDRDYHVNVDEHFYSVPYQLVGEQVETRSSASTVEVYYRDRRVASHRRSHEVDGVTTVREHMPKAHQEHADQSPSRLVARGAKIGPRTERLITDILDSRRHPEQGYRVCLGILALEKRYGAERLEAASHRALLTGIRRCTQMETLLKNGLDRMGIADLDEADDGAQIQHQNVRGPAYYG